MHLRNLVILICLIMLLSGCATKQHIKGRHYLDVQNYRKGIASFEKVIRNNPDDPTANYYLGRFYLVEKENKKALFRLAHAVELAPDNADYNFWLGMAYAANMKSDLERRSYLRTIKIDPNHLPALINLGHNQLEKSEYEAALKSYNKVLRLQPNHPSALYNRGYIMRQLERAPEEKIAWKQYLAVSPSGAKARQAVIHLNEIGDFEYRNHLIGKRRVTLKKIWFDPFTAKISKYSYPSLDVLGDILKNNQNISLHIVTYQKNNPKLARARAKSIKQYLIKKNPNIKSSRLMLSWFDVPEPIKAGGKTYTENESVNFVTRVKAGKQMHVSSEKRKDSIRNRGNQPNSK